MFKKPSQNLFGPNSEVEVLSFWRENRVFEKSVEDRRGKPLFRFLEGPPTANGLPHHGHIRTRMFKDLVLRYAAMRGHYVPRIAGWDTHGLPVELEVQSELGLKFKEDIEGFGLSRFAEECKKSVFKYETEWRRLTERIGFWLDLEHAYITFKNEYIESVWWSLKQLYDKGLIYKGFKVVPYCPRDETPLSSHEVALGYDEADDPSVYVKFRIIEGPHKDEVLVVWTTTPWTLPSNVGIAVNPSADYALVEVNGEKLLCVVNRLKAVFGDISPLKLYKGSELIGARYAPPYDYVKSDGDKYRVVGYENVSVEDGTGILHMAPAFGEEDYEVCRENGLAFFQPVDSKGRFTSDVEWLKGVFVKEADQRIIADLKRRGLVVKAERIKHTYPFCWRCGSPLLYYAWPTWFIRTTAQKSRIQELNQQIEWYPSHIRDGRFGEFLREMVDWALSRNRYWGTPLPIWECAECGNRVAVGSMKELLELAIRKPERLELHRPFVDEFVLRCGVCGGDMRRVSEVIDVWYDSGSASFARFHYPFEGVEEFKANYPVDFISEGVDQTRGWFYSLHVLGTLLFDEKAYRKCVVIGLVLNEKGEKMSKSKKNYVDPWLLLERYGADPFRWHILGSTPIWEPIKFGETGVAEAQRRFFNILENSITFFLTYAELDGFDPKLNVVPPEERLPIDRWLLTELSNLVRNVTLWLDEFEVNRAVIAAERFVVEDLSQWYIRRSRRRFWKEEKDKDKWSAYSTLYEVLLTLSKLLAPIIPFASEKIYQTLRSEGEPLSVHLCDYPAKGFEDLKAHSGVAASRLVVEAFRAARNEAKIKTRMPLKLGLVYCGDDIWNAIQENMELVLDEVNVKELRRLTTLKGYIKYAVKPKLGAIGRRFKSKAKSVLELIDANNEQLALQLSEEGSANLLVDGEEVKLTYDELELLLGTQPGYVHYGRDGVHVFLNTDVDKEMEREWLMREVVRRIQLTRKELNLKYDEKVGLLLWVDDESLKSVIQEYAEHIMRETLAESLEFNESAKNSVKHQVEEYTLWVKLNTAS
ncbi:isoleucine--tRNA ligase [Candidatus Marsarchaeota G2 archaeon OSP_D]|uniref:Isoleucine--tRNA ligase n=2 Tax=Candidatus Marsarchaeota group 2 TaxID=2203771 RepID=A0A2R6B0J4_9ARCH|nr:MAG: isoleucine--tRNA ligase [Candidatus Marsarchaeota G2 archaeon OSP_D]PSN92187.1 MAG: isoleucine--tRNA ligase [Candidatus Marsarchaeota G2 archaeon ECH_B_SAG-M15]